MSSSSISLVQIVRRKTFIFKKCLKFSPVYLSIQLNCASYCYWYYDGCIPNIQILARNLSFSLYKSPILCDENGVYSISNWHSIHSIVHFSCIRFIYPKCLNVGTCLSLHTKPNGTPFRILKVASSLCISQFAYKIKYWRRIS